MLLAGRKSYLGFTTLGHRTHGTDSCALPYTVQCILASYTRAGPGYKAKCIRYMPCTNLRGFVFGTACADKWSPRQKMAVPFVPFIPFRSVPGFSTTPQKPQYPPLIIMLSYGFCAHSSGANTVSCNILNLISILDMFGSYTVKC